MTPALCTIGYEGSTVADLMDRLIQEGVAMLVDVRALPLSRKPGFSKRQLAAEADAHGIGYLHLRGLGTPKAGRQAAQAGHTERMRAIFAEHMQSDSAQATLTELADLAARRPCCLLCYEADHATCHRDMIASAVHALTLQSVRHVMPMPAAGRRGV